MGDSVGFDWDNDLEAKYPRVLKTPDGVDRVVTMTGWHWASFDWMDEKSPYKKEPLIDLAFELTHKAMAENFADNPENFGAEFNSVLEYLVYEQMEFVLDHPYDSANESRPPAKDA